MKRFARLTCFVALLAVVAFGQNRTRFGGRYNAIDYAYGVIPAAAPALQVAIGNTATSGTSTITLVMPCLTLGDGTTLCPVTTTTPITIDIGTNQETVTPSSVSNCSYPAAGYGQCAVAASFTHAHGTGTLIISGTYGFQEAVNAANANGGGVVVVNRDWANLGGANTNITSATGFANVSIEDTRSGYSQWSLQPTTLTSLSAPTTLTSSTVASASACPTGATCSWTATTVHACITLIDPLGGEGPCSADYSFTATASVPVTFQIPAGTLTGAVGWRAYAGASYNAAYLLPVSGNCTLTTAETVVPACALTSTATFNAIYASTTTLRPQPQTSLTVNLANPLPQGHTTFAYEPSATVQQFQTHYGPFPAYGSLSAGNIAVLGSVNLPAGFLNVMGKTVHLRGHITTGSVNTATLPTLNVRLDWVGGTTAGAGINTCADEGVAVGATKTYSVVFDCTLVINAVGSTAVGSVMPDGFLLLQDQGLSANGLGPYVDSNTAAVGSLGLFAQVTANVLYTSTANTTAAPQLLDLSVDVLQ